MLKNKSSKSNDFAIVFFIIVIPLLVLLNQDSIGKFTGFSQVFANPGFEEGANNWQFSGNQLGITAQSSSEWSSEGIKSMKLVGTYTISGAVRLSQAFLFDSSSTLSADINLVKMANGQAVIFGLCTSQTTEIMQNAQYCTTKEIKASQLKQGLNKIILPVPERLRYGQFGQLFIDATNGKTGQELDVYIDNIQLS